MRLICPNCDAQYEVADDVIPTGGRDVQCSNCGQTWYQLHPDNLPPRKEANDAPADKAKPVAPSSKGAEPAPVSEPVRRTLDPSVADILRQEAELESKARAAAAGSLESQPDLGLDSGVDPKDVRVHKPRMETAPVRGKETDTKPVSETPAATTTPGSRRDLLPDIEEINSTLRSTSDRQSGTSATRSHYTDDLPQEDTSFGRGFVLTILLAVILIAIYNFAPQIAQSLPQTDPYLSTFVAQVDSARSWLDGQVASVLTWLDNVATAQNDE